MVITWYGQSCFKIETREATLAIDPFSKEIGLVPPRFRADAILITHAHPDHANASAIQGEPALVAGPGEYEMRGVAIRGVPTFHDRHRGRERGLNTCYRIEAEGIALAHLGDFGEGEALREETLEALGDIDILLVPVGGTYTIGADAAAKVVREIEPSIAIPMHYRLPGLRAKLDPVEEFLRACGGNSERLEKLSVRPRDLEAGKTRIVVLGAGGRTE